MTRCAAWLGGALIFVTTTLAQSGGPAADPISGTWTGSVGPGATPGYGVTLDLKFDGTNAVTGSAQGQNADDSAVVKAGTFDPQTGVLRLELQLKDAGATALFDGVAVLGTATGRLTLSNQPGPGTFVMNRTPSSERAAVAPTPAADANAAVAKQFAQVSGWILKAAELVPPGQVQLPADRHRPHLRAAHRTHRRRPQLRMRTGGRTAGRVVRCD